MSAKMARKEKTTLFLGLTWLDLVGLAIVLGVTVINRMAAKKTTLAA